jgi:hypothetical protein
LLPCECFVGVSQQSAVKLLRLEIMDFITGLLHFFHDYRLRHTGRRPIQNMHRIRLAFFVFPYISNKIAVKNPFLE